MQASGADAETEMTEKFVRSLDRFATEFCGREESIRPSSRYLEKIERVQQLLANQSQRIRECLADQEKAMSAVIAELTGNAVDDEVGTLVTAVA